MKLPNKAQAYVPDTKITEYLLSEKHESGKDKAAVFIRWGFTREAIDLFRNALLQHAQERDVSNAIDTPFGVKYELICEIQTPDSSNPCLISIWIIEEGSVSPRLVTAYPAKR